MMKTIYRISLFTLLLWFTGVSLHAQEDSGLACDSSCVVGRAYFKSMAPGFKEVLISPLRWSKGERLAAGGVLLAGAVLYSQDRPISMYFAQHQSPALDRANQYFFDPFGKMYYTLPLMGGFYLYGLWTKKSKPRAVALDFAQASLYSGLVVTAMKHLGHRHRPYQTDPMNPYLWDGPFTDEWSHTSFPSGHTIMAWTFASVMAMHYKDHLWVPVTVYTLATMEALARVYAQKHWSSDVLIGAALGYAIGRYVVRHGSCRWTLVPVAGRQYTGLGVNITLASRAKSRRAYSLR